MIVTNVNSKDLENFKSIHPRFSEAFDFLKKAVSENFEDGNYEIDGKEIYSVVNNKHIY